MHLLAVDTAILIGAIATVLATAITVGGTVAVAWINRQVKAANTRVDTGATNLAAAMAAMSAREEACLDGLEWAWARIATLEAKLGMPKSPKPRVLSDRDAKRRADSG